MGIKAKLNEGRACIEYKGCKTGHLSVNLEYDAMNTAGKPDILSDIEEKLKEIEDIINVGILSPSKEDVDRYFKC